MSTNYYLRPRAHILTKLQPIFSVEPIHIGLSTNSWAFAMHVYPHNSNFPQNFGDWKKLWENEDYEIINEYGEIRSPQEMIKIINFHSESDKFNRAQIDGVYCIAHGEGPWDLCTGDFS